MGGWPSGLKTMRFEAGFCCLWQWAPGISTEINGFSDCPTTWGCDRSRWSIISKSEAGSFAQIAMLALHDEGHLEAWAW